MTTLREQYLERLTHALFRKGEGFVLKGGAAMRALYGEQRLTKDIDLDFTNPKRTAESLHKTVKAAIDAAARGLPLRDLHVHAPGKNEKSPRWKVNFRDPDGQAIHIEVEVSRDADRAAPGPVKQLAYVPSAAKGVPRFFVDVYDEPTLIATKIAALLGRNVPRDVYDLDLLHQQFGPPGASQLEWALERAGTSLPDARELVWQHLDALTWDRFETELLASLPDAIAERMNAEEWTAMKLRIGEYVEGLLATLEETQ